MARLLIMLSICIFFSGCAGSGGEDVKYPRKPVDTEGRKAGPAMLLYEQAEEDSDVNNSVVVIPPQAKEAEAKPKE